MKRASANVDLTTGKEWKRLLVFALPMFLGQLLQQLYSTVDAWVLGNFADSVSFAAVSSVGSLVFLITGFFMGLSIGGGVIIARYFGMQDAEGITASVHNNLLLGIGSSLLATAVGTAFAPVFLRWMSTPESIIHLAALYLRIYFGGIATVIIYNFCMSIMRAIGDSVHPLLYLVVSSLTNVVLDMLFVAVFHWGVAGAAVATIISQLLSCVLCLVRMFRAKDASKISLRALKLNRRIMGEIIAQGLPTGIQNSVISIGNMVIQNNINNFDIQFENAGGMVIAGQGANAKIEGFVFLPITAMSMTLPTFVSQNLGAGKPRRARRGSVFGILFGMFFAELIGVTCYLLAPVLVSFFTDDPTAIRYGTMHLQTTSLFYCLLAFSHCASGSLRGYGKSVIPMVSMLSFWCVVRVFYVTVAVKLVPSYRTIAMAYPITWSLSTLFLLFFLLRTLMPPKRTE